MTTSRTKSNIGKDNLWMIPWIEVSMIPTASPSPSCVERYQAQNPLMVALRSSRMMDFGPLIRHSPNDDLIATETAHIARL